MKKLLLFWLLLALLGSGCTLLASTESSYPPYSLPPETLLPLEYEGNDPDIIYNWEDGDEWEMLYPFEENGVWGYMDASGNVVIEPQYHSQREFSEGLAFVIGMEDIVDDWDDIKNTMLGLQPIIEGTTNTGYIDLTGELVIPLPVVYSAGDFSDGFAWVIIRKWDESIENPITTAPGPSIFIDRTGCNVFDQEFASADRFVEGFASVYLSNGNYAFINKKGENAFGLEFRYAFRFEGNYAEVTLLDGTNTHIDRDGNITGIPW